MAESAAEPTVESTTDSRPAADTATVAEPATPAEAIDTTDWGWDDPQPAATPAAADPAPESAAIDTSDWGWDDPAPATAAEKAEQLEAAPADAAIVDDWDWEGVDDGTSAPAATENEELVAEATDSAESPAAGTDKKPRVTSTAAPDHEAPFHSGYKLFAGVPSFEVVPSVKDQDMHPCVDCHEWAESDPTPRNLKEPHDNFRLQHGLHGKGEFWCFTCHHLDGDGGLKTMEGVKLEFDEAYILCSQCHSQEARDWSFGAHGKRVGNWRGERRILNCTACHYQHKPGLPARKPLAPPPPRMGLSRPPAPHAATSRPTIWEKYQR